MYSVLVPGFRMSSHSQLIWWCWWCEITLTPWYLENTRWQSCLSPHYNLPLISTQQYAWVRLGMTLWVSRITSVRHVAWKGPQIEWFLFSFLNRIFFFVLTSFKAKFKLRKYHWINYIYANMVYAYCNYNRQGPSGGSDRCHPLIRNVNRENSTVPAAQMHFRLWFFHPHTGQYLFSHQCHVITALSLSVTV